MESYCKLQICAQHAQSPLEDEQLSDTSQNPAADGSGVSGHPQQERSIEEKVPAAVSLFVYPNNKRLWF